MGLLYLYVSGENVDISCAACDIVVKYEKIQSIGIAF
jgi:hypothetical protein